MNKDPIPSRRQIEEIARVSADFARSWVFKAVERLRIGDQAFHILLASTIGGAAALAPAAFLSLIRLAESLFVDSLFPAMGSHGHLIFLLPALGGLLIAPFIHFFPSVTEGIGIPSAMESVALRGGVMRLRAVALRTVAAVLTIGSGGAGGRFAPRAGAGAAGGSGG